MAKTISKSKSASSRARAIRSSRADAAQGRATTPTLDRDATGATAEELDERDDALAVAEASDDEQDEQDESAYAIGDEADDLDDVDYVDDDEDTEDARALALPDRERAPAPSHQRGGVYVPEFLMGNPVTRWLAEAYVELLKVTWPSRRTAWNMTLVVIAVSAAVAIVLGLADFGLTRLVTWLSGLSG